MIGVRKGTQPIRLQASRSQKNMSMSVNIHKFAIGLAMRKPSVMIEVATSRAFSGVSS